MTGARRQVIIPVVCAAALGALVLTHVRTAGETYRTIADARLTWACALLGLAAAGPVIQSGLLRAGQATVGARFRTWEAIRVAAAIHAANLAVKAAGAAGLGVLLACRDASVECAAQSAAYVLGREVAHVAFAGFVLVAVALVGLDGHLSGVIVGGTALFVLSRASHVALLWFAATHPDALPRWRRLDPLRAHAPIFARALRGALAHPRPLLRIAVWALADDALHVGWLWVALHAVGAHTSVDVAVETYGIVALVAMVSVLPAGLGAVDAGLVATLHHSGIVMATAVAGVLLFRVAELWVPLAAGARPAFTAARSRPL